VTIKAVLFDMDGVLVDSHDAWLDMFNAAREHFGFRAINKQEFDEKVWGINFEETVLVYYPGHSVPEVRDYFSKTFDIFVSKIKNIPKVKELLGNLKGRGFAMAVVSNSQSDFVERMLGRLEIKDYFSLIVGGERVRNGKPNPEIILIALMELGISAKDAAYVGDTIWDERAAKAAGCRFVGFRLTDKSETLIDLKGRLI
jgi:phosphoglycolate phosphatase